MIYSLIRQGPQPLRATARLKLACSRWSLVNKGTHCARLLQSKTLIAIGLLLLVPSSQTVLAATTKKRGNSHLQAASAAREKVEVAERNLQESLELLFLQLNSAINAIQPEDFVGERLAIAELRKIVPKMRREALAIIEAHEAYQSAAKQYGAELDRALPTVYEVAKTFKKFAASEPYQDLQVQYVLIAESFEAIAAKYRQKKKQVGPSITAVSSNLAYTKRTALFLERLEKFLVVMPSDSPDAERFLKSLAKYVQSFETLRGQLTQFHRATVGGSSPGSEPRKRAVSREGTTLAQKDHPPHASVQHAIHRGPKSITSRSRAKVAVADSNLFGGDSDEDPFSDDEVNFTGKDLSGLWAVENDSNVLRFVQKGSRITVSLFRSAKLKQIEGKLRVRDNTVQVEQLLGHLHSGETLNLKGGTWKIQKDNQIRCTGPSFSRNASGEHYPDGSSHVYQLRRL